MAYRILADVIVIAHLAFIAFVLFGGLLALRWRWIPWLHLPAATWGFVVALKGWICPLTPLENVLRRAGGSAGYESDFIDHYIVPIIYPVGLTRELQIFFGLLVLAINLIIYLGVRRRARAIVDDSQTEASRSP
jgi:hypothetical protein